MKISKRRFREIIEARLMGKPIPIRKGDWVRVVCPNGYDRDVRYWEADKLEGKVGRVIEVYLRSKIDWVTKDHAAIRFREKTLWMHDCHSKCEFGHGWYLRLTYLQFIFDRHQIKSIQGGAR